MSVSSKSLSGRSSRSLLFPLVLIGLVSLTGCGGGPLSLLTGGGPNVLANTQAGKTNSQTIGTTNNVAPTVSLKPNSRVDSIDQSTNTSRVKADNVETVVVNEVPVWVILLLILGWLLPSPAEIGRMIVGLFKRKKQ